MAFHKDTRKIPEDDQRSVAVYKHTPLDTSLRQIRLLSIQPAGVAEHDPRDPTPIHCSLRTYNMKSAPPYTALSYMWGNPHPVRTIFIDNLLYKIHDNLFNFLGAIRHTDEVASHFWIDQICIDQDKLTERNHQVRLMTEIYMGCHHVIAWLGVPVAWKLCIDHPPLPSKWRHTMLGLVPEFELKRLPENKYFTRLWIVQELKLAPRVHFLYGLSWIAESKMRRLFGARYGHLPAYWLLYELKQGLQYLSEWPRELTTYCVLECQDPRDKIYGLFGLLRIKPKVDYSKSVIDVYVSTMAMILAYNRRNSSHGLDMTKYMSIAVAMGITGLYRSHTLAQSTRLNLLDIYFEAGKHEDCGIIWYRYEGFRRGYDVRVVEMTSAQQKELAHWSDSEFLFDHTLPLVTSVACAVVGGVAGTFKAWSWLRRALSPPT